MVIQKESAVNPRVLSRKLQMVQDSLLPIENEVMEDDFEYFSMIGQGVSCTPNGSHTPTQYGSPSTRRVRSVKQRRSQQDLSRMTDNDIRERTNSMPVKDKEQLVRVRHFETSSKGIQNRGDSVKVTGSQGSLASTNSSDENGHTPLRATASADSYSSDIDSSTYRILLLGGEGTGKTSLTQQFLTSDDVNDEDYLDDGKERSISVLLDKEESFLTFMDSDYDKNNYDPSIANAYIVVYSITDRNTFEEARGLLKNLRHFEKTKAIILCGNKIDLARKRLVSGEEGEELAKDYEADFIETSTMLNHKVDNLLVSILRQTKYRENKKLHRSSKKQTDFKRSIKGFVDKIVRRDSSGKKKDHKHHNAKV